MTMTTQRPVRIQRRRTKGWKMPPATIYVGRPSKWGNPFVVLNEEGFPWLTDMRDPAMPVLNHGSTDISFRRLREEAVRLFREQCVDRLPLAQLRGKNLACWCPLCAEHANGKPLNIRCENCAPCHADVLGELSNA